MRHSMPARARFCPTTLLPSFTPQARPALRRGDVTHGNMGRTSHLNGGIRLRTKDEVSVSFLPLSHVTARHVICAALPRVALAYCPTLRDCAGSDGSAPNIFIAVPRVYEKIRQQVILKTSGFQERYLSLGVAVGAITAPRLWPD